MDDRRINDSALGRKLDRILRALYFIAWKVNNMASLEDTLALAQAENTKLDSLRALLDGIEKQLADIIAGQLPAPVQAKVDALFDQLTSNVAKVDAAIATGPSGQPTT